MGQFLQAEMRKLYGWIVNHGKVIQIIFFAATVIGLLLKGMVAVNYDMNDYLPASSPSTVSLEALQKEFDDGIPNARIMVRNVTIPEAMEYKEKLEAIEGVTSVTWLDDEADITIPLSFIDEDTINSYYRGNSALFNAVIEKDRRISAVNEIREIIGDENAMAGSAVSTAYATMSTVSEIRRITVIAVIFVFLVLLLTTNSWLEPFVILAGLGVAIAINGGSNLIFGEISFVTNAACSILQLAVSLDYSVFLIHRFEECRVERHNETEAMVDALCKSTASILSSGLTTVIGFLALVLMQFRIGPDLGLALAKGVLISLVTVFFFMPALVLTAYKLLDRTRHKKLLPGFYPFGIIVRRIAVPMVLLFFVMIVPSYLASNSNEYFYGASAIFDEKTKAGADSAAIEDVFGENDVYVLMVPKDSMAMQTSLSNELHELPQVTGVVSYVDMVGAEIPTEYLDQDTLSRLVSGNYSRMVLSVETGYEGEKTFELVERIRGIAESYYPEAFFLAGEGISTYDLKKTVTADMVKVNAVAVAAVFLVLLLTLRSFFLPVVLVLCIETAIWINLAVPYFMESVVFYIAYLIISTVQLGATVDYAILMTDRYVENRRMLTKKDAVPETISNVTVSIITSGIALMTVGLLLHYISTNRLLAQLGLFIGRGAILSIIIVLFVLPGLLYLFDGLIIKKTTGNSVKE